MTTMHTCTQEACPRPIMPLDMSENGPLQVPVYRAEPAETSVILQEGYQQSLELVSLLLGYPTAELGETLHSLNQSPQRVRRIPRLDAVLGVFARTIAPLSLLNWQELYVQTFDLTPATSLHLTWHVFGDSPRQGRALAAINEVYRDAGFSPVPGELPDYLPMMLEFMAVAPEWATVCLGQKFGGTIAYLAAHLSRQDNPYAPLLEHVLEVLGIPPGTSEVSI